MSKEMTVQGKARDCAKAVAFHARERGHNWRYQMVYFGTAMHEHMQVVKDKQLTISPKTIQLVLQAEQLLAVYCAGKDCSFRQE
jgi:hypothetical protein